MKTVEAIEKLTSLFKEEMWGRIEPKDIGISKFRILEDYFNSLVDDEVRHNVVAECHEHLKESESSITAFYLLGLIAYHFDNLDDKIYLKKLIDLFLENGKWAVVEHISDKVLEYGENRVALKALATARERLGRQKEAVPIWEDLLKIDRFDADVAKKLSFAILLEDQPRSVQYMKLALEGFIRNRNFMELEELWSKLIPVAWEDRTFFERIERMLFDANHKDLAAGLLKSLFTEYKENDVEQAIEILKKILRYDRRDINSRKELIKLYEKRYGEHSQFKHFVDLSRLRNFNVSVSQAIQAFENNIIFDKGNYVYHRSWKLGYISELTSDSIVIDFQEKKEHKMSIDMALQSLTPINKDHYYVKRVHDADNIRNLFDNNFIEFFRIIIESFGNKITVPAIKLELIPEFVEQKNWSKWWSKARTTIKKSSSFGFSEKQKDLIFLREKPVTFADELQERFNVQTSFSTRLSLAYEFVNNVDVEEAREVAGSFVDYFQNSAGEDSPTKLILSYFILKGFVKYNLDKDFKLEEIKAKVLDFIKSSNDLPLISIKITSYDYKKEFINLIKETRSDWQQVVTEILFELPVRIHKYIINNLIRSNSYKEINDFIDRIITSSKRFPEIFLWVARNIFHKIWDYDWMDFSRQQLTLALFRVVNELNKFEIKGNRLKNMAESLIFEGESSIIGEVVDQNEPNFLQKLYDLALNSGFIDDSYLESFLSAIKAKFPDFNPRDNAANSSEEDFNEEQIIVSQEGYDRKSVELNKMLNVEMPGLSKDLSKAADIAGDVRENVDYNALVEKQAILKMAISKLDAEVKSAKIINFDDINTEVVSIGTRVELESVDSGEKSSYSILGPWDADYENQILSYRSPMAKLLLKKKVGDLISVKDGELKKEFKVTEIKKFTK